MGSIVVKDKIVVVFDVLGSDLLVVNGGQALEVHKDAQSGTGSCRQAHNEERAFVIVKLSKDHGKQDTAHGSASSNPAYHCTRVAL